MEAIKVADPTVYDIIDREYKRQRDHIELIASENFVSQAVMDAVGSCLTNKYAEGLPNKRYYGGCEIVDEVEVLAIERLLELFKADHANVQPHSGSNANVAVYMSVLKPGDKVLGMNLSEGGHLTHGNKVNFSGMVFDFVPYGVNEDDLIDNDKLEEIAIREKPKMIIAGASAYPRKIDFSIFDQIAKKTGALLMCDIAHIAGLVAAGLHQSPVPYADFITSTTHKTLRGPRGGVAMCKEEFAKILDKTIFPGFQGGPLMHVVAGKAVAFGEALKPEFRLYQEQVLKNAKALAERLMENGFRLVSGGTDNHLILIDLKSKNVTGNIIEKKLDNIGIAANKNAIPRDTEKPTVTSGLRVGTAAMTTRGMKEEEMCEIADIITGIVEEKLDDNEAKSRVKALVEKYPLY